MTFPCVRFPRHALSSLPKPLASTAKWRLHGESGPIFLRGKMRDLEQMKISRIQIAECPLPLPHTLRLGPVEIQTRDYIAVRIWTDAGVFGEAIGYPRGTPLFETMQSMARKIIGGDTPPPSAPPFHFCTTQHPGGAPPTRRPDRG